MNKYHIEYGKFNETPFMGISVDMANKNSNSICKISLSWITKDEQIKAVSWYIKPPTTNFYFSSEHGITADDVKDALPFYKVWEESIAPLMNWNIFASHYCQLTMKAIIDSYEYDSDRIFPANNYLVYDTYIISKDIFTDLSNYKLKTISQHIGSTIYASDVLHRSMAITDLLHYLFVKHPIYVGTPKIMAYAANKHCFSQWKNDIDDDYGLKGDPELS